MTPMLELGVDVAFPLPRTWTDSDTLIIRGQTEMPDRVSSIHVAGVPVTTTDGHATWQAEVSLAPGLNTVTVQSEDVDGVVDAMAAEVVVNRGTDPSTITAMLANPTDGAVDRAGSRMLVADSGINNEHTVIAVDMATSEQTQWLDTLQFIPDWIIPNGVAIDPATDDMYLAVSEDSKRGDVSVHRVDLTSGMPTLVGESISRGWTEDSVYVPVLGRMFLLQRINIEDCPIFNVVALDVTTGASVELLADRTCQDGGPDALPNIVRLSGLTWDESNARLVLSGATSADETALFTLDSVTGAATPLTTSPSTGGPSYLAVASHPANERIVTAQANSQQAAVWAFDAATDMWITLSDSTTGTGPQPLWPRSMEIDGDADIAFVTDLRYSAPLLIDLQTGERVLLAL